MHALTRQSIKIIQLISKLTIVHRVVGTLDHLFEGGLILTQMPSKTAYVNTSAYVNLVEEVEKRAIHAPATVAPLTDARDVGNRDQTRGSSVLSDSIARVDEVNEVKETRVIKVSKPKSTAGPGVESLDSTAANGARTVSEAPPRGHNAVDIRL